MNGQIDFMATLNSLADDIERRRQVTEEQVYAKARTMAKRGYRFTEETLALVKPYLEGRGLLLGGDVGVGKTFFFLTAGVGCGVNLKIAQGWPLSDLSAALESFDHTEMLVDDVGVEELEYKSYGTATRIFEYILEHRMHVDVPTHFTTNLTPEQILERYGQRVVDRITELATYHRIGGESHRSPDAPRSAERLFTDFIKGRLWRACARDCRFYSEGDHRCMKDVVHEPRSPEWCLYF